VDAREGVTHALRSSEYHDHNALYNWVLEAAGIKDGPIIEDFSRLNFTYTILSKRKLQWFVNKGKVEGWDDPCFPTVRGVIRRGMTDEALRKFILQQGSSKNLNLMDMSKLWALNKQIIDPIVPRYVVVVDPVVVKLSNFPEAEVRSRDLHRKNPALGKKVVHYSNEILLDREDVLALEIGEEVTLMDWGNAVIKGVERNDQSVITVVHASLHLEGDFKTTKKKLTWISNVASDVIPVELVECQNLLTKPKLEKETKDKPADQFEDFIPEQLKIKTAAVGEQALKMLAKGEKIQLERKGYFICDKPFRDFQRDVRPAPLVLINIPDGKQKK
jgi:glutamyl-tRNA synthetase